MNQLENCEYIKLSDAFNEVKGMGGVSNKWAETGNCRFIDYMNAYKHLSIDVNNLPFATVKSLKQDTLQCGDVLFTSASEVPDECAIASEIEDNIKDGIFLDDHLFGLRTNPHYKQKIAKGYLKYFFRSEYFRKRVNQTVRGVTRFYIAKQDFMRIQIPIPPLEIQKRIVEILDHFTNLTANLTAEFNLRRKQFEHYREILLTFGNDVECRALSDIFSYIRNGFVGTVTPYFTNKENGVRYLEGTNIHNGVISDNEVLYVSKEFHQKHIKNELKADDILMVQSGHIGECAIVGEKYAGANCHALIIMSNNGECVSKYVVYYFHSINGFKKLNPAITGGTLKHILAGKMGNIKIPVPPLAVQQSIVEKLDKYTALIDNIEKELALRQKQYEYYREQLLTF